MPNFDAGSYFLTTLAPIKAGQVPADPDETPGTTRLSWQQKLRRELALLPTAMQSPATVETGLNSPFARNRQTHLCRFVVIDDVVYNGRPRRSTIVNRITGRDPIKPEPVDRLNAAYLLFAADIDAVKEPGERLPDALGLDEQGVVRDRYARRLWETMEPELRRIYGCCVGFDKVENADDFARYIRRVQVETTMPFHDYWITPPQLKTLPITLMGLSVGIPAVIALLSWLSWLFGSSSIWLLGHVVDWAPGSTALVALVVALLAVAGAYALVMSRGQQALPPPEYGDLPTVLKSLYLQQHYSRFAVAQQGADDDALYDAFADFLEEHRPDDTTARTQAAGTVSLDLAAPSRMGGDNA